MKRYFFVSRIPIHFAAYNGHMEVLKLLLESGANHEIQDYEGNTSHDYALMGEEYETANYLDSL